MRISDWSSDVCSSYLIPKITPVRAAQLGSAFAYAQAVLDASAHNMVIAGLPSETADALVAWLDDPANAALLLRSANAQAELRALLPAGDGTKAGPLAGKTVVLTGSLSSTGPHAAKEKLAPLGPRPARRTSKKTNFLFP